MTEKVNLLDYDRARLTQYFAELGEPSFRATQIIKWVHQLGKTNFAEMTNLSKKLRDHLVEHAEIRLPEILQEQISFDGTRKWMLKLQDGQCIETVLIPENDRGTLCVSSQVGCIVNCQFCSTARQGFNRNLTIGEIIGQVRVAVERLSHDGSNKNRVVTNIVMMGMGEPLLNFENVVAAMDLMKEDIGYNLSRYRVTLSTSGIVPAMYELATRSNVSLAVSLHASNNALRDKLVPINKKYPLEQLIPACKNYFKDEPKRSVTFEYVMLDGVNDSPTHARELSQILQGIPSKINLIPFNPFPDAQFKRSKQPVIDQFRKILANNGYNTITRKTRGDDIDAACGQLVGQVNDRSRRTQQWKGIKIAVESGLTIPRHADELPN